MERIFRLSGGTLHRRAGGLPVLKDGGISLRADGWTGEVMLMHCQLCVCVCVCVQCSYVVFVSG